MDGDSPSNATNGEELEPSLSADGQVSSAAADDLATRV